MKDFLLALVSPIKMRKYRYMSVFISMLIFVIAIYCISIPNQNYINMHKDEFLQAQSYVNAYFDLPDETLDEEQQNAKYKVEDGELKGTVSTNDAAIFEYNIEINISEDQVRDATFYFVFDINNSMTKGLEKVRTEYKENYPDASDDKVNFVTYICYTNMLDAKKNPEFVEAQFLSEELSRLDALEIEALKEESNDLTNFDLFGIDITGQYNYLLLFFKETVSTQVPYVNEEKNTVSYPVLSAYYKQHNVNFDFSECKTLNDFGKAFVYTMFNPLADNEHSEYLMQVVGYVLLFPAVFSLLLCWCMRKRGVMKTFKEYYNVAGIASIIPTFVSFIAGWFVPNAVMIYGILFTMFTLFGYMKINTTPELGD